MKTDRDPKGRFAQGNAGGPGNPHAGQVSQLRAAILEAVKADDVVAIIEQIILKARQGDLAAAKEILDRTVGKPAKSNLLERIEALEAIAARVGSGGNRES